MTAPAREELRAEAQKVGRLLLGAGVGALAWLPSSPGCCSGLASEPWPGCRCSPCCWWCAPGPDRWRPSTASCRRVERLARARPAAVDLLELLEDVTSPWTFRLLVLLVAAALWRFGLRRLATWALVTMAAAGATHAGSRRLDPSTARRLLPLPLRRRLLQLAGPGLPVCTAGLVAARKQGRAVFYRLSDGFPDPLRQHCLRALVELSRDVEQES